MDQQDELISWQPREELSTSLKLVCVVVIVAAIAVSIAWPVMIVPMITFGLSSFLYMAKSRRLGQSLGVVAFLLYAPFGWVLTEWDRTWMNLWPVLPGLVAGLVLFNPFVMGLVTLFLLVFLTRLGASGGLRLAIAGNIALALSMAQTFSAYSLYRF